MSEGSKRRSDRRWAARYARSQAAFEARGRDSDMAGGWVEHVSSPDGVGHRLEVIPPGEPVGDDYGFYARFALSFFVKGWFPRASNEDWVVQVTADRRNASATSRRFGSYHEALGYVRQARTTLATGGTLDERPSS